MSRFEQLVYEKLTKAQRLVYDEIASGPRGHVGGPLAVWLKRPELADRAQKLGEYARYNTMLPPRLSELAILLTARIWSAEYEWWVHRPIAEKAGISPEIIESIRTGNRPTYGSEEEEIVHEFCTSLHLNRQVDDKTYFRAVKLLGQDVVVDLVGVLGYYTLISMTINAFHVCPPEGLQLELSDCTVDRSFYSTVGKE